MAAHLREIHRPRCQRCHRYATKGLHNTRNAHLGDFCSFHATAALREQLEREVEEFRQRRDSHAE